MSKSTALAIIGKPNAKAKDAKAEKVASGGNEKITPPVEILRVPSALLLAAESTAVADSSRPYFGGVYLHRREKIARVVGAEGPRMFIGSFALPSPMPTWLNDGILLSVEGLKKRVQMIVGLQDDMTVKLSHTKGSGFVELSDEKGDAVFRLSTLPMEYPNYEAIIGAETFACMDEEGNITGREFEPVGINSRYLKHCGEIAKTLEAGIPKKERPKNGMVVRAYNGQSSQPMFFGFDQWPGAVLVVAPVKLASASLPKETAALMAPAIKLTLAALTAHETRNIKWAEAAATEEAKAEFMAKAAGFRERINAIVTRVASTPAIAADYLNPKPETKPAAPVMTDEPSWDEPVKQPVADEPEPEPEPTPEPVTEPAADDPVADEPVADEPKNQPEVKRTKIKVNRRKAA